MIAGKRQLARSAAQRSTHRLHKATRRKTDKKLDERETTRRGIADCNERIDGTGDDESGDSAARRTISPREQQCTIQLLQGGPGERTRIPAIRARRMARPGSSGNAHEVRSAQGDRLADSAVKCKPPKVRMPATPLAQRRHGEGARAPPCR